MRAIKRLTEFYDSPYFVEPEPYSRGYFDRVLGNEKMTAAEKKADRAEYLRGYKQADEEMEAEEQAS